MPLNPNNPEYKAARNIRQIQPIVDCRNLCANTVFLDTLPNMHILINSGTTAWFLSDIEDTVSQNYGNGDGSSFCQGRVYTLGSYPSWFITYDAGVVSLVSNSASDSQGSFMLTITVTLNNYPTTTKSFSVRTALYSDDPSIAIQAPCAGYDVARPAELD